MLLFCFVVLFVSALDPVQPYPEAEVPTLQPAVRDLFLACGRLALTVLELMGLALKLNVRI